MFIQPCQSGFSQFSGFIQTDFLLKRFNGLNGFLTGPTGDIAGIEADGFQFFLDIPYSSIRSAGKGGGFSRRCWRRGGLIGGFAAESLPL